MFRLMNMWLCTAVLFMLVPAASGYAQTSERCFPETGFCIAAPIRSFWEKQGGLPVFGFPTSPRQEEIVEGQTVQAQWFERERFEIHAANSAPYDILLGRLGDEALRRQGRDWRTFPKGQPKEGCQFFAATEHTICEPFLSYWQRHGVEFDGQPGTSYAESLALFGLPLSEPAMETNSSGFTVRTQWFERARFEFMPDNPDPYKVLLGLLGNEVRPLPVITACVEFEAPLMLGTQFGAPAGQNPGSVAFTSNAVPVSVDHFVYANGGSTFNYAQIDTAPVAFGNGQSIRLNNIDVKLDFSTLGFQPDQVSFEFLDLGGTENLSVNSSPLFVGELAAAPQPSGGINLTVATRPVTGGKAGTVRLTGPVSTLQLGGQEFWIDRVCASNQKTPPAGTVTVASSTFKVRADQPVPPATRAAISAARNEFEGFQILVTGPATAITATATILSNGTPQSIPMRLYREALIDLENRSAPDGWTGLTSDALIPDVDEIDHQPRWAFTKPGFTWTVPSGQTQAIWVEVRVPDRALSGTYTGSVAVTFNEGAHTLPVVLTVYDFTLPAKASLKSHFGLSYGGILAGHNVRCCGPEQSELRAKYDQLALDHRFSLGSHDDGILTTSNFDQYYGKYVDGTGPTQIAGSALTSVKYPSGLTDIHKLRVWFNHFVQKGWPNILFQYTCDEPPQFCTWSDIPTRAQAAKTANPDFRTLVTTNIDDATANTVTSSIDILVPLINHLDARRGRFAGNQRAKYDSFLSGTPRKEVWMYQSCASHGCAGESQDDTGWPSYMIDASATRNRAMPWLAYKYRTSGELYYETTQAFSHNAWTNQWDFTGNGDGTLFYPGTPSVIGGNPQNPTNIPIASFRMKMIREGYEDYEYLKLLSDLGDPLMAATEVNNLFPNAYSTDVDPQLLMAARSRIAQRIMQLRLTP